MLPIRKSQEQASSQPPPSAYPSIMAIVGLDKFHIASMALLRNICRTASEFLSTNSEISAPATKAWGLARFPSEGGLGGAPEIITILTESSSSAHLHIFLSAETTS